jgi:predicted nuclease with TOPRIM domain
MATTATKKTSAATELRARVERLENENTVLKSAFADLAGRLEELEAERKAELEDYERREAALFEFAKVASEPPDEGTNDPREIARREAKRLGLAKMRELFSED